MEDTRNLPAGEAMARQVRDLQQKDLDEVVAAAKTRKAELLGKIGDLTLELERVKADNRREYERGNELRTQIAELETKVAGLQEEIDNFPLLFQEQVMSRLRTSMNQMKTAAIAEIMK